MAMRIETNALEAAYGESARLRQWLQAQDHAHPAG